ncbi:MAG: 50S ribosomal protein L21 [Lachnospiraceae bacterium]|nr:50S ribosomal protein L21 [Lachnospiraceae bacterium]
MYAIIATGGKQYKVSTGDKVRVEKLDKEVGDKVSFKEVLLISDGTVTVGNPYVEGALVEATVVDQAKDKKVIVYKYKPKTGYHKKKGHRQLYTELEIGEISVAGKKAAKKEPVKEAEAEAAPVEE